VTPEERWARFFQVAATVILVGGSVAVAAVIWWLAHGV